MCSYHAKAPKIIRGIKNIVFLFLADPKILRENKNQNNIYFSSAIQFRCTNSKARYQIVTGTCICIITWIAKRFSTLDLYHVPFCLCSMFVQRIKRINVLSTL